MEITRSGQSHLLIAQHNIDDLLGTGTAITSTGATLVTDYMALFKTHIDIRWLFNATAQRTGGTGVLRFQFTVLGSTPGVTAQVMSSSTSSFHSLVFEAGSSPRESPVWFDFSPFNQPRAAASSWHFRPLIYAQGTVDGDAGTETEYSITNIILKIYGIPL